MRLFVVGIIWLLFLIYFVKLHLFMNQSINQSIKKEAIHRASKIAEAEGNPTLEVEHLQKILPQLLLDFWRRKKKIIISNRGGLNVYSVILINFQEINDSRKITCLKPINKIFWRSNIIKCIIKSQKIYIEKLN